MNTRISLFLKQIYLVCESLKSVEINFEIPNEQTPKELV